MWNAIFEMVCQSFADLERDGIDLGPGNGTVFPIVIGNKGDWSYLALWFLFTPISFYCGQVGCKNTLMFSIVP